MDTHKIVEDFNEFILTRSNIKPRDIIDEFMETRCIGDIHIRQMLFTILKAKKIQI